MYGLCVTHQLKAFSTNVLLDNLEIHRPPKKNIPDNLDKSCHGTNLLIAKEYLCLSGVWLKLTTANSIPSKCNKYIISQNFISTNCMNQNIHFHEYRNISRIDPKGYKPKQMKYVLV